MIAEGIKKLQDRISLPQKLSVLPLSMLNGGSDRAPIMSVMREESKIVYFDMPKAGCTSIKRAFLESEAKRDWLDQEKRDFIKHMDYRSVWQFYRDEGARISLKYLLREQFKESYFHSNDIWLSLLREGRFPLSLQRNLLKVKALLCVDGKFKIRGYDRNRGFGERPISIDELNSYFIFTFVRNPLTRLVSIFDNKYVRPPAAPPSTPPAPPHFILHYDSFYGLETVADFDDFIRRLCALPDRLTNRHVLAQSAILDQFTELGVRIDFIGRIENLPDMFEPIRARYGLLPLEHTNTTDRRRREKWQRYYSAETAALIYQRHHQDFERFGYHGEYEKLQAAIKSQGAASC